MLDLFAEPTETILSVSEYNNIVQNVISSLEVTVEGELTEFNLWQNKYLYATLKDKKVENVTTSIFGVCAMLQNIHSIKVGDLVHISGTPGIHGKTGRHSLQANAITKIDAGYHTKKREELIRTLEQEGIIDPSRKRRISRIYNTVVLITAVPSQAYNDFIKIYNNRWGQGRIIIIKAQMQGNEAEKSVLLALDKINRSMESIDCIVIARGGGSKEDLITFDSEAIARMIFASKFPVISAIGHEGDVSVADLVADVRASTPSNAAEIVTTPTKDDFIRSTETLLTNLVTGFYQKTALIEEIATQTIDNIQSQILRNLSEIEKSVDSQLKILNSYDINLTLNRGFSLITNDNDMPVQEHQDIIDNNTYSIYLKNGKKERYNLKKLDK